jgi:hypothetical protein
MTVDNDLNPAYCISNKLPGDSKKEEQREREIEEGRGRGRQIED